MPAIASGISRLVSNLREGAKGFLPLIILATYTIVGALIFREIEGPNEEFTLETMKEEREKLIERTIYKLNGIRNMKPLHAYNHTKNNLLNFTKELGVDEIHEPHWTFFGSTFYCIAVYTTIGYGNIIPLTVAGRVLTILYAFIGIPLAVISLFALGQLFAKFCKFIWKLFVKSTRVVSKDLERKVTDAVGMDAEGGQKVDAKNNGSTLQQPVNQAADDDDDLLSFPIGLLIFFTIVYVIICATIFWLIEDDWSYGTSMYFTLISFTTIGFGDVIPSEYDYMIIVGILLLIGLSLVSTVMTLIQQQIEALANGVQANIDKEYMNALAEAADEGELTESMVEQVETDEQGRPVEKPKKVDGRSLDAVISRMPLKERLLYHVMPSSSKKRLQKHSEGRQNRATRGTQTGTELLEILLREELLKMELNNELDRLRPGGARIVSTGVREKMVPVEITRQYEPQNFSLRDDSPRPSGSASGFRTQPDVKEDEV